MDKAQTKTFETIVARCMDLIPPLAIEKHIKPHSRKTANNTLDGIEFEAVDPAALEAELSGRMKLPDAGELPPPGECGTCFDTTRGPRSPNASMIGMKDDPTNWALEASLGATVGVGFREQWRPPPDPRPALLPAANYGSKRISLGFGETGKLLKFTALHASVSRKSPCNVHIDERGFMVATPDGAIVTPTFWGHLANELLLKTKFRDWLNGKIGKNSLGAIVVEAVNRVSLRFPDAENGFAGLEGKVNSISGISDVGGIGKAFLPIGLSADLLHLKNSTVQANYYWHEGQQTITLTWGGTFDRFGSK
jgi:hypothetical protein